MKNLFLSVTVIMTVSLFSCGEDQEKPVEDIKETCFYAFDESAKTTVRWTAFESPNETGVGGEFTQINIIAGDKSTKITNVLRSIMFNIPTNTTYTGDKDRDEKIINSFFGAMDQTDIIIGQVTNVEGNNENGKCSFYLTMNNIEKEITLNYVLEDNVIKLTGRINIASWNGADALSVLRKAYGTKYQDNEGVACPMIELSIESVLKKDCH